MVLQEKSAQCHGCIPHELVTASQRCIHCKGSPLSNSIWHAGVKAFGNQGAYFKAVREMVTGHGGAGGAAARGMSLPRQRSASLQHTPGPDSRSAAGQLVTLQTGRGFSRTPSLFMPLRPDLVSTPLQPQHQLCEAKEQQQQQQQACDAEVKARSLECFLISDLSAFRLRLCFSITSTR